MTYTTDNTVERGHVSLFEGVVPRSLKNFTSTVDFKKQPAIILRRDDDFMRLLVQIDNTKYVVSYDMFAEMLKQ